MLGEENRICARALVGALLVTTAASCHWVFPHQAREGDSTPRDSRVVELAVLDALVLDGHRANDHDAWRPADRTEAASCAGCVIEGICHAKGETHPGQPCFVCEPAFSTILWAPAPGCVVTLAGDPKLPGGFANGASSSARFNEPHGVALDGSGRVYVADTVNNRIRVIENGLVSTLAGDGTPDLLNGPAAQARFRRPKGIAVLGAKVYVADTENHCVRVIENGSVTTLAGDGTPGTANGPAATARFNQPRGLAVAAGKVIVADSYNHRIRLISSGTVSTIAGSDEGFANGEPITVAKFRNPRGVGVGPGDKVHVADTDNHRIRVIDVEVSTLVGTPVAGLQNGPPDSASFNSPSALAWAPNATLYVADAANHAIRSVAGTVTTLGGDGTSGHQDGPLPGRFGYPRGIAVDAAGRIYVADLENHCIRVIRP